MKNIIFYIILITFVTLNCSNNEHYEKVKSTDKTALTQVQSKESDSSNSNNILLSKEKEELIGLETVKVEKKSIEEVIELPAELMPNPNNIISINVPISGRIVLLNVNIGVGITKGSLIAVLENPQNLGQRYEIKAPMGGVITSRPVNLYEWVENGKQIAEIVDYSNLHGIIHLFPDEQNKIKVGESVEFNCNGIISYGKIITISPFIDPITKTLEARVLIPNQQGKLKSNSYATAKVIIGKKIGLIIPLSAVLSEETHFIVFTKEDEHYEKHTVEIGLKQKGEVEIKSGLKEGDIVVSEGAYQLKNISFTSKATQNEGVD